ncbi:MAG: ABC transporter ATP-binding protein [Alphaproteobacteria bacterium]|nr:ABC transporter ATP-binding protein [Alphaproteobacteria bacterium]
MPAARRTGGGVVTAIVRVSGLTKEFPVGHGRTLRAVDGVEFAIGAGETLGLVGESGSGKSTTGRILIGLIPPTAGDITLFGRAVSAGQMPPDIRRRMQFVFQDPSGALNPRMRVGDSIAEPLAIAGEPRRARQDRVAELLEMVGLPRASAERYPHEFSGGQRQRIGIARALALRPEFIVCDEPVSALDVSMQAQVVNLLLDLQEKFALSYLFIAHDLAVVRSISTQVAVMYAGRLVEIAPRRALYDTPRHPYTRALLAAVPRPDPDRPRERALAGEIPSILDPPAGCAFAARCPLAEERCRLERPALREVASGQRAACHFA